MNKHTRNILSVALAALLLVSGGFGARRWQAEREARLAAEAAAQALAAAEAEKDLPEEPVPLKPEPVGEPILQDPLAENAAFLLELDLDALRVTNADVLGWIHIPGTAVDFPLMESADNADYLSTTWDGRSSTLGSIFLECMNSPDLSDFNTIVYGHNIRGGKMFGSLHSYKEQDYRDRNPFVYILADDGLRRYEVFAAYEAGVTTDTYRLYFEDDARRLSALQHYVGSSVWNADTAVGVEDHILTLSTCTGTGRYETRWVVQAVQTGFFEVG